MFETVIGLEVHLQLNTKTKLFCSCPTSFAEHQNTNTCPTCLALPGALPVVNKEAAIKAMRLGYAINGNVNHSSNFDRKSYFYPDSPSAYQITQLTKAIVQKGEVFIDLADGTQKRIGMTQAHLEADAGKNMHDGAYSKVDLNRAGTPLLEIVSEPDMRSSEEAILYLKKLHAIVRYLGISDANMQEGSFRVDVNVSVRPKGQKEFGTRVEIKNINSFKFIKQAIDYEVERHIEAYEYDEYEDEVVQETRLFDSKTGETRSMRGKEESADYRYFPDPDLLPVDIEDEMLTEIKNSLPELPTEKKNRFISEIGLSDYDAENLTAQKSLADYYEAMLNEGSEAKLAANWVMGELSAALNKNQMDVQDSTISAKDLSELVKRISDDTISGKIAKDVFKAMWEGNGRVDDIIESQGLKQMTDVAAIENIIDGIIANNSEQVEQFKAGNTKLLGYFVGQVMKATQGKANPKQVNQILNDKLS